MKKIIFILLLVLLSAGNVLAEGEVDGYWWGRQSEIPKMYFLNGFLMGHRISEYTGTVHGYGMGETEAIAIIEKEMNIKIDKTIKMKMLEIVRDKIFNK